MEDGQNVSPWSGTPAQASFTRLESGLFWFVRFEPGFVVWMPFVMMLLSKAKLGPLPPATPAARPMHWLP